MIRGTTPTITIELPHNVPVSNIDEAIFSISQEGREVIQKRLDQMELDADGNTLGVSLSQNDTFRLKSGQITMQLKVKVGEDVTASEIVYSSAREILNEDVI